METKTAKREYSVWSEGYAATGNSAPCMFHGKAVASSFPEACENVMRREGLSADYDKERNRFWGCRLFETKAEAEKSFG